MLARSDASAVPAGPGPYTEGGSPVGRDHQHDLDAAARDRGGAPCGGRQPAHLGQFCSLVALPGMPWSIEPLAQQTVIPRTGALGSQLGRPLMACLPPTDHHLDMLDVDIWLCCKQ